MNPAILVQVLPHLIPLVRDLVVKRLEQSPTVPVERQDRPEVKRVVETAVEDAVKQIPEVRHATNTESWYRSNVTWGSIFAILGGTATIGTHIVMGTPLSFEAYGPPVGAIWGGLQALYGRWVATKPIGR